MPESRNHIKNRMLRTVARAWGMSEAEPETNFDPILGILLTACATELEKISGDVHASRARVLERLVQLLSPDAFTGAVPAHAVATATPIENTMEVRAEEQYYFSKRQSGTSENEEPEFKDIFFSPTSNFRLNKASISYMATGNTLYRLNNAVNKEQIAQGPKEGGLPACTLWLGIDQPGISLAGSSFYFDIRNDSYRELFYHQLPKAIWYWNDQAITHLPGYGDRSICGEQLDIDAILNKDDDISGRNRKNINAFYKSRFVTLTDTADITSGKDNSMLEAMIQETFGEAAAKELKQTPVRWLCIDFPQTVNSRILQDVVCSINAFPVFNRRYHDITHRLQDIVNIIPLQTDDIFLDLEEVSNDDGRILNLRNFQDKEDDSFRLSLRQGGTGRFDERDAASLSSYMVQLLRDESAAFSSLGTDFMNNEIKQLQQIINKLEQRLFSKQIAQDRNPYLILRNGEKKPWQNVFVRFWSTAGLEANNIKAGNALHLYRGSGLKNNQITLVAGTQGGRNRLGGSDAVLAYKNALLSKGRIVTEEDIRAFCHHKLGSKVRKIEVRKGVMVHPGEQNGFMKTLDIHIFIAKKDFDDMNEKGEVLFWTEQLPLLLEQQSMNVFPYRVMIQKAA